MKSTENFPGQKKDFLSTRLRTPHPTEWVHLKPLLQQLYIKEDLSLQEVRQSLRQQRNLNVTRKQLTKRFGEWGLRKNVSKHERNTLLGDIGLNSEIFGTHNGVGNITPSKMIRWRKGVDGAVKRNPVPGTRTAEIARSGLITLPCDLGNMLSLLFSGEYSSKGQTESSLAVIGRLCEVVGLNISRDFPSIVAQTDKPRDKGYAAVPDILHISDYHRDSIDQFGTPQTGFLESATPIVEDYPFRWNNVDFDFPSGIWILPSPYHELSPFPCTASTAVTPVYRSPQEQAIRAATPELPRYPKKSDIQNSLQKLRKLRSLFSYSHPAVVHEKLRLGSLSYLLGDYRQAEHHLNFIVKMSMPDNNEFVSLKATSTLFLSWAIWMQDDPQKARKTSETMHSTIIESEFIRQELKDFAFYCRGHVAHAYHQYIESDCLYHELIQLWLPKYGPYHSNTIHILHALANLMMDQHLYQDSQELLRVVIELGNTNKTLPARTKIDLGRSLARLKFQQKCYSDAESLYRICLKQAEASLEENDSVRIGIETGLVMQLMHQKKIREAEEIIQSTVAKHVNSGGEGNVALRYAASLLGCLLYETDRFEEAIKWMEIAYKIRFSLYGPIDEATTRACSRLGLCYERQGRYEDALKLYQSQVSTFIEAAGPDHGFVRDLHEWIVWVQTMSANERRQEETTSHDYEGPIFVEGSQGR